MNVIEYMYEVNYSVYYPDTDEFKPNRTYQICATSELNAACILGQIYSFLSTAKRLDIQGIKKIKGYERQVQPLGLGE